MDNSMYEYFQTSKGMKICMIPLDINTINIGILIPIGAYVENQNEYGLAHFLEHMLFTKTSKYTEEEINDNVELYGGNINAYTFFDQTLYNIKGNSKYGLKLMDILTEIYFRPIFTKDKIEREKLVIYEEMKLRRMNPGNVGYQQAMELLFTDRYSKLIIGTEDDIKKYDEKTLTEFKKKYYNIFDTYLIIAGKYDKNAMLEYCNNEFGKLMKWTPSFNKLDKQLMIEYPQQAPIFRLIKTDIEQIMVNFYFKALGKNSEWTYHFNILENILTGSLGSIFNISLRNNLGATYGVSSSLIDFKDTGYYVINYNCNYDKLIDCIKETLKILKESADELFTEAHLERAKNQAETQILMTFDNPSNHFSIAIGALSNNIYPVTADSIRRYIDRISLDSLKSLCQILFDPKNMIVTIEGKIDETLQNKLNEIL